MGKNTVPKGIPAINLIKNKKASALDKIIVWALSIGRLLVIVTEVIAFSAFLYRFGLDRQLIDLHDEIKRKQRIIVLYEQNEKKFRSLQNRLAIASEFSVEGAFVSQLYKDILLLGKDTINIQNMAISDNTIQLEIKTPSVTALSQFINGLNSYEAIESVSINKIENKTASAILVVHIGATLNKRISKGE